MNNDSTSIRIGFIGQGWVGKNYADDFEKRGFDVVRYSLEEPYISNRESVKECEIVFVAVPTPTTKDGFSSQYVEDALQNLSEGTTAIIKSTILPGTTIAIQEKFPHLYVMHSPEFLRESSAAYDAANPERNIIGIPSLDEEFVARAEKVLSVLPSAKYQKVMPALEAELVKYVGNCFLYSKVVMMNVFHDIAARSGAEWDTIREAVINDPRIGESHTAPVHKSGHVTDGDEVVIHRGAGGHCFIKDFEAMRRHYGESVGNDFGHEMLTMMINYNNHLLRQSAKDLDLLQGVYGDEVINSDHRVG